MSDPKVLLIQRLVFSTFRACLQAIRSKLGLLPGRPLTIRFRLAFLEAHSASDDTSVGAVTLHLPCGREGLLTDWAHLPKSLCEVLCVRGIRLGDSTLATIRPTALAGTAAPLRSRRQGQTGGALQSRSTVLYLFCAINTLRLDSTDDREHRVPRRDSMLRQLERPTQEPGVVLRPPPEAHPGMALAPPVHVPRVVRKSRTSGAYTGSIR